jgi:hypothetical protein
MIEDHQHVLTPNAQKAVVMKGVQAGLETKVEIEDHQHVLTPNAPKVVVMKSDQVDLEAKVEIEDHQHVLTPNAQKAVVKTNDQAGLETKAKTEDHQHVVLEMKGEVALTETKTMTADQRVQPGNLVVRIWLKAPKRGI